MPATTAATAIDAAAMNSRRRNSRKCSPRVIRPSGSRGRLRSRAMESGDGRSARVGQATGPDWLSVRGAFSWTALPSVVGTVLSATVGAERSTLLAGSIGSLRTVVVEASDFEASFSFFISSTSDLNTRAERPRLRAASGRRFQPKMTMRSTATMMISPGPKFLSMGSNPPFRGRCLASVYSRPWRQPVGSAYMPGGFRGGALLPILRAHPVSWLNDRDQGRVEVTQLVGTALERGH